MQANISYLIVLFLATDFSTQISSAVCRNQSCSKGQECRFPPKSLGQRDHRKKECLCIRHCPRKAKRRHNRICGSDGFPYESECHLYRFACRSGLNITPHRQEKSCLKDPLVKLKELIEKDEVTSREPSSIGGTKGNNFGEEDEKAIQVPVACNQKERNEMRDFIINFIATQNDVHTENSSYLKLLSQSFEDVDMDEDKNVDSIELFHYFHRKTETKRASTSIHDDIIIELELQENLGGMSVTENRVDERKLCMDALVEEGDANKDWRLSKSEYMLLLNRHYRPSDKYCIKDRKMFEDGTTIRVDCNGCVCACGKWICTAKSCSDNKATIDQTTTEKFDDFSYDDMDNQIE